MKSYQARIARLEKILGPRSKKAALRLLVDIMVQAQREEDRQERSSKRRPPKVNPDEGGMPAVCEFQFRPAPPEKAQPPPAYIAYMASQAAQVQSHPPPPATPKARRKSAKNTSPVVDLCVFPAHWQFNRSRRRDESEDEQRRRVPPLVI